MNEKNKNRPERKAFLTASSPYYCSRTQDANIFMISKVSGRFFGCSNDTGVYTFGILLLGAATSRNINVRMGAGKERVKQVVVLQGGKEAEKFISFSGSRLVAV
jgi:hypothetical protein